MRIHQLVLDWIEAELRAGSLRVGGKLPAERSLAQQLQVSRTSVREAIRVLEAMGVVRSGVGSGPDSGTVVIADPTAALGSALRLHVASSHLPVRDIVQTRVLLESWAAVRADAESPALLQARRLWAEMETAAGVDEFLALDARFHVALAASAGNAVVSAMMGSLRESIQDYAAGLTAHVPDWSTTRARLHAEHEQILAAVLKGDGGRAARLVTEHIEGYYAEAGFPLSPN